MKAITVRQPWASLIAAGVKTVETRPRACSYRGRIAIHAAKARPNTYWHHDVNKDTPPEIDLVLMSRYWEWTENVNDFMSGGAYRWVGPLGAVVASAVLKDCVPIVEWGADPIHDHITMGRDGTPRLWKYAPEGERRKWRPGAGSLPGQRIGIIDQLPFGDFSPGRYALLLDDIAPTTQRCPLCWNDSWYGDPDFAAGKPIPTCPLCFGDNRTDPVPARGQQAVPWNWQP